MTNFVGRPRLLFTSTIDAPFITGDLRLLERSCDVKRVETQGAWFPFRVVAGLLAAQASITWFASTYAFLVVAVARVLRKPSILIIGGVDAARRPEFGYGIWLSPWKSLLVRSAVRRATRVLVVAPRLGEELKELARYDGSNIEWVPMGFDSATWIPGGVKKPIVLTVAACTDLPRMRVKGVDQFLRCAAAMPETEFRLVGTPDHLLAGAGWKVPENVRVVPFVSQSQLLGHYQEAAVYFLPSEREGMPNTLCEAMLCGCIPVVTDVGGVRESVGDVGHIVRPGDSGAMVEALRQGLSGSTTVGEKARNRIAELFPLRRRERDLLRIVEEVLR